MSEWGIYEYETEEQRRRRERRARRAAERLLTRYQDRLAVLEEEGLVEFVADEYRALVGEMDRLRELLRTDPQTAHDEAILLGARVAVLPRVARRAAEQERQRREELRRAKRQALSQLFEETVADLLDPVERDFAYEEIQQLIAEKDTLVDSDDAVEETVAEVRRRIAEIRARAQAKAAEWRAEQQAAVAQEVAQSVAEALNTALEEENQKLTQHQLNALQQLSASIVELASTRGEAAVQKQDSVREAARQLTSTPSEEDRRQVVQGLYHALTGLGFVVEQPVRVQEQGKDVVVLRASRPAGQRAELKVTASGELDYKFDQYEGMACKQDIDRVMDLLQSVYGIKLSKHRVSWQNPDRISKTARSGGDSVGGAAHGR